jgi:hypothetical protein
MTLLGLLCIQIHDYEMSMKDRGNMSDTYSSAMSDHEKQRREGTHRLVDPEDGYMGPTLIIW